jgi:hypothetical protein
MKVAGKMIPTLIAEGVEELEYYVSLMRLQEESATVLSGGMDLKSITCRNGLVITPDTLLNPSKWMKPRFAMGIKFGDVWLLTSQLSAGN